MSVYQIAIFADGADSYAATLRATIQRNVADLGIPAGCFLFSMKGLSPPAIANLRPLAFSLA